VAGPRQGLEAGDGDVRRPGEQDFHDRILISAGSFRTA